MWYRVLGPLSVSADGTELARVAVHGALTVAERLQANRDVLSKLRQHADPDPARVVHHAEQAGDVETLVEFGPVAAEEATRHGAHRQAAETLRVVLAHHDRMEPARVAELLTRRAYSLYVINRFEDAFGCASFAVAVSESAGDPSRTADALMALSKAAFWARGPMAVRAAAQRAVDLLEELGDTGRLAAALADLARAWSNLATISIVAEPSDDAARHAERALELGEQIGRHDLVSQALCYLGSSRLAVGDRRGVRDLDRAIALMADDPRAEVRVRAYVNAAGSAYRAGCLDDAERYVAAGLRLTDDVEFFAGEYRLRLTAACVRLSRGDWDQAIGELHELTVVTGDPGVMRVLAMSLLARLLARRGDRSAPRIIEEALTHPSAAHDERVAGPLAAAQVEIAWLSHIPASELMASPTVRLALTSAALASRGELHVYLRRAGVEVEEPRGCAGPWALTLAGKHREAAEAWKTLGDRYEHALSVAAGGAPAAARQILSNLGATATVEHIF